MAETLPLAADQLDAFLTHGYVVLQPTELAQTDHDRFYRRAAGLYEKAGEVKSVTAHLDTLGDNLRAQIPELDHLLADPVIDGALTSVLGPDYVIHPHSYCHRSSDRDQPFHQDGNLPWNERGHYRSHTPDWAMLFYYPQAVDGTNGPTEVVPGSQYWTVDHETPDGGWYSGDRLGRSVDDRALSDDNLDRRDAALQQALVRGIGVPDLTGRFLHLPVGAAVLAHYDLVHRGSRTRGAADPRFMYKFYFARVRSPIPAASNARLAVTAAVGPIQPVVAANQRWLAGLGVDEGQRQHLDPASPRTGRLDCDQLALDLLAGREDVRIAAAYKLGRAAAAGDSVALETLAAAVHDSAESTRRAAGHGLRQAGQPGVPVLLKALDSPAAPVRRPAAAGLGSLAAAALPDAVATLIRIVAADPDILVRSIAAYSLGQISRSSDIHPGPIVDALLGRLAPGAEEDNAFGAALARSTVRQSAAYGLLQAMANHAMTDGQLDGIVCMLPKEPDRYVQGMLVEGLARTKHMPDATRRELIAYLAGRRWNPSQTPNPEIDTSTRLQ